MDDHRLDLMEQLVDEAVRTARSSPNPRVTSLASQAEYWRCATTASWADTTQAQIALSNAEHFARSALQEAHAPLSGGVATPAR